MTKIIMCRECGRETIHHAKGLCRTCYSREYRKQHPNATISGLRAEKEYEKQELAAAIDRVLSPYGVACRYEDGEVVVVVDGREYREKI